MARVSYDKNAHLTFCELLFNIFAAKKASKIKLQGRKVSVYQLTTRNNRWTEINPILQILRPSTKKQFLKSFIIVTNFKFRCLFSCVNQYFRNHEIPHFSLMGSIRFLSFQVQYVRILLLSKYLEFSIKLIKLFLFLWQRKALTKCIRFLLKQTKT